MLIQPQNISYNRLQLFLDSGEPIGSRQVYFSWGHHPLYCFPSPRLGMVLHQGALQDASKGDAEGPNYGGAAAAGAGTPVFSSSEEVDYGRMSVVEANRRLGSSKVFFFCLFFVG